MAEHILQVVNGATGEAVALALVLMAFDVVAGFAKACKAGNVSSTVMREGAWHKAGFVGLVFLAAVIQWLLMAVPVPSGVTVPEIPLVVMTCAYVAVTEAVSIFENLCSLNPAIAGSPVGKVMEQLEKADDKEGGQ